MAADLTIADAATQLQVSDRTVRRLVGRGELAAYRVGHQLRITSVSLESFKRTNSVGSDERQDRSSAHGAPSQDIDGG